VQHVQVIQVRGWQVRGAQVMQLLARRMRLQRVPVRPSRLPGGHLPRACLRDLVRLPHLRQL